MQFVISMHVTFSAEIILKVPKFNKTSLRIKKKHYWLKFLVLEKHVTYKWTFVCSNSYRTNFEIFLEEANSDKHRAYIKILVFFSLLVTNLRVQPYTFLEYIIINLNIIYFTITRSLLNCQVKKIVQMK